MPASKTELRRVSVRAHDDTLRCDVVSGIGFAWRCTCGKRGKITGSRAVALAGKREHEAGHHTDGQPRARPNDGFGTPRELTATRPDALQEDADVSDRARG